MPSDLDRLRARTLALRGRAYKIEHYAPGTTHRTDAWTSLLADCRDLEAQIASEAKRVGLGPAGRNLSVAATRALGAHAMLADEELAASSVDAAEVLVAVRALLTEAASLCRLAAEGGTVTTAT